MKAEHTADSDSTFDRISTREELCEVIDVLCDSGNVSLATRLSDKKHAVTLDSPSTNVFSTDLTLEEEEEEDGDETDELTSTLSGLLSGTAQWLN